MLKLFKSVVKWFENENKAARLAYEKIWNNL